MSKVLAYFMQKAFTTVLAKSFSRDKMNQEDQSKLFESMLSDYLNNIAYAERTGDISLKKSNGEWKINIDDSLKKLYLGIDASTFSGKATKDTNDTKEIKEMTLNQPF